MRSLISLPRALWRFLVSTYRESQRVSWPGRSQTLRLTSVVIGVCLVLGAALTLEDYGLSYLLKLLIK